MILAKILRRFFIISFFITFSAYSWAEPNSEIAMLLVYVGDLDGFTFIRNNEAHTPKEAEAHLRMKWQRQEDKIHSAEDFIEFCATKSYLSGKLYFIQFPDGHKESAANVLAEKLKELRGQTETQKQ